MVGIVSDVRRRLFSTRDGKASADSDRDAQARVRRVAAAIDERAGEGGAGEGKIGTAD